MPHTWNGSKRPSEEDLQEVMLISIYRLQVLISSRLFVITLSILSFILRILRHLRLKITPPHNIQKKVWLDYAYEMCAVFYKGSTFCLENSWGGNVEKECERVQEP